MTEIGKAYGGSLFMLAREEGLDAAIGEELTSLCGALREDYDFVRLMVTPTLKKSKRLEILAETFEGKVHEYVLNFMSILVRTARLKRSFRVQKNIAHFITVNTASLISQL